MNSIYLDYAAATPLDKKVALAMEPFLADKFYNPSATYLAARYVRQAIDEARLIIARWLGCRPTEVYFTAGATEANNLAIQGVMRRYPNGEVLVSAIEHDSVLAPAALFSGRLVPVTPQGITDVDALSKLITPKTVLISVMLVNNELGTLQPLKAVAALVKNVRDGRQKSKNYLPLYLHTDAAQAANLFDLHASRLGVDMMSLNGGKIYGPKQSGLLYVKTGVELAPLIVGGGQERGLRSGTENIAGIVGLAKALDIAQTARAKELKRLTSLRNLFVDAVKQKAPSAIINGSAKHRSPHLLNVSFPGSDNERLMLELDEAGVQCAVGSACSASSDKPSHVLSAIGLSDELAQASLRFSFGRQTSEPDIKRTVELLARFTGRNR